VNDPESALSTPVSGLSPRLARAVRAERAATDRLGEIHLPTVAIVGQQDLSAIPADLEAIANGVEGCRYVLVDPGTHMMPMEQPDALSAALLQFRRDVDSGTSGLCPTFAGD